MKIDYKNIIISVVSFSIGFCAFWWIAKDTISDMKEINYKTIELMDQYESVIKVLMKRSEQTWL